MRKEMFLRLLNVGFLDMNPMVVTRLRQKYAFKYKKHPEALYGDVIFRGYLLGALITFVLYGAIFGWLPYDKAPFMLDVFVLTLSLMGFIQGFVMLYNVVYESHDLPNYLSLPISSPELFYSRLLPAGVGLLTMISPLWPIYAMFLIRHKAPFAWAVPLGAVYTVGTWVVLLAISLAFLQLMGRAAILRRFRRGLINALMITTQLGAVAALILAMRWMGGAASALYGKGDAPALTGPLSGLLLRPFGPLYLLGLMALFAVLAYLWTQRRFARSFGARLQELEASAAPSAKRPVKVRQAKDAESILTKLSWSALSDSTVFMASVVSPQLMTLFIIVPNLMSGNLNQVPALMEDPVMGSIIAILAGFFWAFIGGMMNTSYAAIAFSLDGDSYQQLMALPFPKERYFRMKWKNAFWLTSGFAIVAIIGIFLYMGVARYLPVTLFVYGITQALFCRQWLYFDLRHLMPDWHNVMELYSRTPNWRMVALLFGSIFGVTIVTVLIVLVAMNVSAWLGLAITLAIWCLTLLLLALLPRRQRRHLAYPWGVKR